MTAAVLPFAGRAALPPVLPSALSRRGFASAAALKDKLLNFFCRKKGKGRMERHRGEESSCRGRHGERVKEKTRSSVA